MRVLVAGASLRGSGYPNGWQTVRLLRDKLGVTVLDCGHWLPEDFHLWKLTQGSRLRALVSFAGLLFHNLLSLLTVLLRQRRGDVVYVPYPAVFLMWMLSWIPRRIRPRCVVDAYISIWDAFYRDRNMGQVSGRISRLVACMEGRALRTAWRVVVDTQANRDYLVNLFGLREERVLAMPLAIDESTFIPIPRKPEDKSTIDVLFIGTFVPLHGVDVLLEGIRPLLADSRFRFVVMGDGQSAGVLERLIQEAGENRIEWLRGWYPLAEIAESIRKSDICLGVFGGSGKAARVLPFKLYMYLAMGKPVVTQQWFSWPDDAPRPPVLGVVDATGITEALLDLVDDRDRREEMGKNSLLYYEKWLGSVRIVEIWGALITQAEAR